MRRLGLVAMAALGLGVAGAGGAQQIQELTITACGGIRDADGRCIDDPTPAQRLAHEERTRKAEEQARREREERAAREAEFQRQVDVEVAKLGEHRRAEAERHVRMKQAADAARKGTGPAKPVAPSPSAEERRQKDAEALAAREKARADAKQRADAARRQHEARLRAEFKGRAATCAGGGEDILYLQTSWPSKLGCDVRFEARCPGAGPGLGVSFGQTHYVGGSCMGIGDAIRIGPMPCQPQQVEIRMTRASCPG